jgi:HEAT repeat protein
MRNKKLIGGLVVLALAAGGGVAWKERAALGAWYTIRRLVQAGDADRDFWARRAADWDEQAVPGLLASLRRDDARACDRAAAALALLAARRDGAALGEPLATAFPSFSPAGQQEALALLAKWLLPVANGNGPRAELAPVAARALSSAAASAEPAVHARALAVAEALLAGAPPAEVNGPCRGVVSVCLSHPEAEVRIRAVRLAMRPEVNLLVAVVPLLSDPVPEVRRAAMVVVGTAPEVLATDELLRWLHDPDAEVRRLCEEELRSRGLTEAHLRLGKVVTDPRPGVRLKVLEQLTEASDLDPGVWLRRLSHDDAPAVRAAALRALAEQPQLGRFRDRLEQMAQNDPSPTVQQLAGHYLRQTAAPSRLSPR